MAKNKFHLQIVLALLLVITSACATAMKIAAYEDKDRAAWQLPGKVVQTLGIRAGDVIADLGSGSGYFTFLLADATGPAGKVYATDIDKDMNNHVNHRAHTGGYKNVETILAKKNDPLLPVSGIDLIFSSNSYHHLENRTAYFANAGKYLKPGGRVAIIDFRAESFHHHTDSKIIRSEMEAAEYRLEKEYDFLPRQHFLVFKKD